jgi:RimJ/RimL family protein N-acetyltransferase
MASPVPAGWPEFPEAIDFSIAKLNERPDEADWWMHFFLDQDGRLVGSGGFVGPPANGVAEIGYEIAPEFRGRGYATAAARAMVAKARANVALVVIAHTLTHQNPSTSVLKRLGFRFAGEVPDGRAGQGVAVAPDPYCLLNAVGRTTNTTRSG